ncbi:hypothetical protein IEQ34_026502 [Dendrobium chrysotoxum]|uniref:Endonuclease/exonuclease/phosphatase domain-containing protein n=1 Tax=Dendrobium chrysotoxum TaxID=161865 RepID=A0AAV7FM06_DENCH|nr:hypothetical protein IEQ34_026502 [Dendrobium chrysotoxum]
MSASRTSTRGRRSSNGFSKKIASLVSFSPSAESSATTNCGCGATTMFNIRRLCSLLRRLFRRRRKSPVIIRQFPPVAATQEPPPQPIRIATFNAAMFSMAPPTPNPHNPPAGNLNILGKTLNDRPKSILKRQQTISNSKRRVSINLPEDQISIERSKQIASADKLLQKGKAPMLHQNFGFVDRMRRTDTSVLDVLMEVDADVFALQNVKAEEEKGMKPLSDLADGLGMKYVFAESWAPEFGNAILSKWPIKQCRVQKICDDADFRNVLKVTIEVPRAGEVNLHCTHLDHLDEAWRMKQISAMLRSSDEPYILAGGLNTLDETDYSEERWNDIIKYHEENGKPRPKAEVMRFLKGKNYIDAKNFAGECEAVVVVAKGQDVQGTCKYGTRVDYILASPGSPYKFLPGSYGVISSKGTSDHHIVKVDIVINGNIENNHRTQKSRKRLVKIDRFSSKGIWKVNS